MQCNNIISAWLADFPFTDLLLQLFFYRLSLFSGLIWPQRARLNGKTQGHLFSNGLYRLIYNINMKKQKWTYMQLGLYWCFCASNVQVDHLSHCECNLLKTFRPGVKVHFGLKDELIRFFRSKVEILPTSKHGFGNSSIIQNVKGQPHWYHNVLQTTCSSYYLIP